MHGHRSDIAECVLVRPPCVRSKVKSLIQDYWQVGSPARTSSNAFYLDDIRQRAFHSKRIQTNTQYEAGMFYHWVTRELRDPMGALADSRRNER
jgi:hypothetical protein